MSPESSSRLIMLKNFVYRAVLVIGERAAAAEPAFYLSRPIVVLVKCQLRYG